MTRYFMQLRGGAKEILDPEGCEFSSLSALREGVLLTAQDILAADVRLGFLDLRLRIDAEAENGEIVHTLHLKNALEIIPSDRSANPRLIHPSWLFQSSEKAPPDRRD